FTFGSANTTSTLTATWAAQARVDYFVDGGTTPVWSDDVENGSSYDVNQKASTAAVKPGVERLDGWYIDPECTKSYTPSTINGNLKLFAKNMVKISFAYTKRSFTPTPGTVYYKRTIAKPIYEIENPIVMPQPIEVAYGYRTALPTIKHSISYIYDGSHWLTIRQSCYYQSPVPSGATISSITADKNTTYYIDLKKSFYDGAVGAYRTKSVSVLGVSPQVVPLF
ncbi:MAG: hypothetical protein RR960_08510, partial [Alistipes sp.]